MATLPKLGLPIVADPCFYPTKYHVRGKTQSDGQKPADQAGATTHWLRRTFGTTAVAGSVPFDVVQQQLGHADISTTKNIYSRAPLKCRADELSNAFR